MRRYVAWTYWFAVVMVGVFGTMAADVLHVGFRVPYIASLDRCTRSCWPRCSSAGSAPSGRCPSTASTRTRREAFYWAAVVATFAMGTALGDLTAVTFHLGYFISGVMFAALILIPADRLPAGSG